MLWADKDFDYVPGSTTKIYYGKGRVADLPEILESLNCSRPFLVTSPSIKKSGLMNRVERILGKNLSRTFDETTPHSPIELVRKAFELFSSAAADSVISLGGGSSVDTGKGVVHFQLEENKRVIPHIAIPTTLSGAEFTQDVGITYGERKKVHHAAHMMATVVLLDPEAALITPSSLLLPSGLNAMHHCIEGICSIKGNRVSEALFLRAIRLLRTSLPQICKDPTNIEVRGQAQVGAALAALAVDDLPMGLGHAFAHAICGRYKTPHAQTHAILIAPVMEFNHDAVLPAQVAIGEAFGVSLDEHPEVIAKEGINRVRQLLHLLGLPKNLPELGIRDVDEALVENVMNDPYFGTNPKAVDREDVLEVIGWLMQPSFQGGRSSTNSNF